MNSIVIVVTFPFSERDASRYGIEQFAAAGFDVHVLDLTWILQPYAKRPTETLLEIADNSFVCRPYTDDDVSAFIAGLSSPYICLFATYSYVPCLKPAFDALCRTSVRAASFTVGAVLPYKDLPPPPGILWSTRLKRLVEPTKRRVLLHNAAQFLKARARGEPVVAVPPIDSAFVNCEAEKDFIARKFGRELEWIRTHIADLDRYRNIDDGLAVARENICAFMDEDICVSHEIQLTGDARSRFDEDVYYERMERFFRHVEESWGLEVVICVHPRARYGSGVFGGRRMVKGRTPEFTRKAKLAVTHHSTAISFAVLARTPIAFLSFPELNSPVAPDEYGYVTGMSEATGQPVFDLAEPATYLESRLETLAIDPEKYDRYFREYIAADGGAPGTALDALVSWACDIRSGAALEKV